MELEFNYVDISGIAWSDKTCVVNGQLNVCKQEIIDLVKEDPRVAEVKVEIASPGESVRILSVKDVMEPRVKLDERGGYFGGVLSTVENTGCGRTLVLSGAAVVLSGPCLDAMEGIIDMTGPGAEYSPFSSTYNVILWVKTVPDLKVDLKVDIYKETMQMAERKVAIYLASHAADTAPSRVKKYTWEPVFNDLPRFGYIHMISTRSPHDACLYGTDVAGIAPTVISPLAAIDGALENGACRTCAHRNTTYHCQNSPVVIEALERHLKDINFAGVIVTIERISHEEKEKNSALATNLASLMKLDGIIATEENAGNPDADLMMVCRKAEKLGIKAVIITDECAGQDGMSQGLADTTPEADAVITNGNANEIMTLPPMDKVIGNLSDIGKTLGTFADSLLPDGSIRIETIAIPGACSEMGYGKLTCEMI